MKFLANLTFVISVILIAYLFNYIDIIDAQYDNNGIVAKDYSYGGGINDHSSSGGGGEDFADTFEDRPKVKLGLRLRIPAFKFELPRATLPKITISAKIRQPDQPRTINLPEINLDTSSRLTPPGIQSGLHIDGGGGRGVEGTRYRMSPYGGAYSAHASEQNSYHHHNNERENTFTFSTDEHVTGVRNRPIHNSVNNGIYYSASNANVQSSPKYIGSTSNTNSAHPLIDKQSKNPTHQHQYHYGQMPKTESSDEGFYEPVYLEQVGNQMIYKNSHPRYPKSPMMYYSISQQRNYKAN